MFGDETFLLLDPWFLGIVPLVLLALLWRLRRPRAALPTASAKLLAGLPRSLRARLVHLPAVLRALGLIAIAVALSRPVTREVMPLREQGVDILLVLDVSTSMNDVDMADDRELRRIDAAKDRAIEFARGRTSDRVGLMTFAQFPEMRCPLTLDKAALAAFVRGVDTVKSEWEDGTAIGAALAASVKFFGDSDNESKVVVFLSDGRETVGEVDPDEAIKLAVDAGLRVHTIGLGQGDRVLFGGRMPADFGLLERIAERTGGRFFVARDADALEGVYAVIDEMEKVELEDPRYRTTDQFGWPLLAAIGLLVLALGVEVLWIRGAP